MRYIHTHIHQIIETYKGEIPLAHFLKNYFRKHPKLGSRDRKLLSEMAYSFYRFSKGLDEQSSLEKKLQGCLFLSDNNLTTATVFLPEEWMPKEALLEERIERLQQFGVDFLLEKTLGLSTSLSSGISTDEWVHSLLQQPKLFIRLRKNELGIKTQLQDNFIAFEALSPTCLSLPNAAAIDKLLTADDYVVQDASSQQTGNYFLQKPNEIWWDCCSGAGGKSLLLKDLEPSIKLTVSDVRASILNNLSERFHLYKHHQPEKLIVDASDTSMLAKTMSNRQFDNILCDVPCTGSGTWARTPEQLYFFKEETIKAFSERQRKITSNAIGYLKKNGRLIYITCSVFKEENEDVVTQLLQQHNHLSLQSMNFINGIANKADCMFIAVMTLKS